MPYTIDPSSADCYPCTSVLINKFDLRSQQELDRVEAVLVTAKAAQWEESPLCSTFDFEHYKAIHRHLFCDLYEWAGVPRSINISKKGTQFCPADEIPRVSSAIFRRLAEQNFFQSLSFDDFVDAFVDFYIRTNELHPFREGNGRTQRVFLAQLAQHAGYQLDFSCIDPDELMERFVRGDSSRSTEGNGLGLSIAQSLTELQGGKMALAIDGDLFKAILRFPTVV